MILVLSEMVSVHFGCLACDFVQHTFFEQALGPSHTAHEDRTLLRFEMLHVNFCSCSSVPINQ